MLKKTYTIEQFKSFAGSTRLDVVCSPKTGKLFFTCGNIQGPVTTTKSLKQLAEDGCAVSLMADGTYLLHGVGSDNVAQYQAQRGKFVAWLYSDLRGGVCFVHS